MNIVVFGIIGIIGYIAMGMDERKAKKEAEALNKNTVKVYNK